MNSVLLELCRAKKEAEDELRMMQKDKVEMDCRFAVAYTLNELRKRITASADQAVLSDLVKIKLPAGLLDLPCVYVEGHERHLRFSCRSKNCVVKGLGFDIETSIEAAEKRLTRAKLELELWDTALKTSGVC